MTGATTTTPKKGAAPSSGWQDRFLASLARYANVIGCNLQQAPEGCLLFRIAPKVQITNRQLAKYVRIAWIERHRLFQAA